MTLRRRAKAHKRSAVTLASLLAVWASAFWAIPRGAAEEGPFYRSPSRRQQTYRSLSDTRPRPLDELRLPRFRERVTHRGWQVLADQFVVVADTSAEDARWTAEQFAKSWTATADLADIWCERHRDPSFALGAVEIIVTQQPVRRDEPTPSPIRVMNEKTVIQLQVGPGEPELESQLPQLQVAAAHAFFHTAQMDQTLPGWVRDGLAAYVATRQWQANGIDKADVPEIPRLPIQVGSEPRIAQDRLPPVEEPRIPARPFVQFLLEGKDGQHALEFISQLHNASESLDPAIQRHFPQEQRDDSGERFQALEQFWQQNRTEFENWQQDPFTDPVIMPGEETGERASLEQRQMAFVLRLLARFSDVPAATISPVVRNFDRVRREAIVQDQRPSQLRDIGMNELAERIARRSTGPWAIVGWDGGLIVSSHEGERVAGLLSQLDGRYRAAWQDQRWTLVQTARTGQRSSAWLESDPQRPGRSRLRIETEKAR